MKGLMPSQDFPVPWVPGTQYEICMVRPPLRLQHAQSLTPQQFDKNGVTGGCQAVYSVYQAPNYTLANPPTCQNFTYPTPSQVLDVDAQVDNGPMSQYGWIDQVSIASPPSSVR